MSQAGDWRPSAPRAALERRAAILARIRAFFAARGVLEVDTPALSPRGSTDPVLGSFVARPNGAPDAVPLFLHTSPEFPMKRLVAAGSGPIYQVCKVFRVGEAGGRHNPEFTMLEWYRPGWDYHALMDEVEALVSEVLEGSTRGRPAERLTYGELFARHLSIDPHRATAADLRDCARDSGVAVEGLRDLARDAWLDLLLSHLIQPRLGPAPVFVHDFPESQAALARVRPGMVPVAERFELFIGGMEIANGFHELADPGEQRRRFLLDRAVRRETGLPDVPMDERLLAALEHGLPECAGVALGIDRLLMVALGAARIEDVIAFPVDRA